MCFVHSYTFQRKANPLQPPQQPLSKYGTIEVLQRIRAVVRDTATPSWYTSAPPNFGDADAGTLKADEWRSLATVYMPLALVSSWGEGTEHASADLATELRHVLDHSMALFSAVRLTCSWTVTPARQTAYQRLIAEYVADLPKLHSKSKPRPNHHMAQHIGHFLRIFGPVHSWWCFPFERLIGLLQQVPSNHKLGA
jgi:hypothetical protein